MQQKLAEQDHFKLINICMIITWNTQGRAHVSLSGFVLQNNSADEIKPDWNRIHQGHSKRIQSRLQCGQALRQRCSWDRKLLRGRDGNTPRERERQTERDPQQREIDKKNWTYEKKGRYREILRYREGLGQKDRDTQLRREREKERGEREKGQS